MKIVTEEQFRMLKQAKESKAKVKKLNRDIKKLIDAFKRESKVSTS